MKEAVFPFARFPNVDTLLGPEMKSTGEVMGIDAAFPIAFAKSQIGAGTMLPSGGTAFVSVKDADKPRVVEAVKRLSGLGLSDHRHGRDAALPGRPRTSPATRSTRCLKAGRISWMLSRTARFSW